MKHFKTKPRIDGTIDLTALFTNIAKQMGLRLEQVQIAVRKHPGEKGSGIEKAFRKFLIEYFPNSLDVTTGFIIDLDGNQSKQMDVIICDSLHTTKFYESGDTRIIPVECVYAVIEVKKSLNKKKSR